MAQSELQTGAGKTNPQRQAMVRAAVKVIAEVGVDRMTLAAVGQRAGFSRALPSYHFASKEALVLSVTEYLVGEVDQIGSGPFGRSHLMHRLRRYFLEADATQLRALFAIATWPPASPEVVRHLSRLDVEVIEVFKADLEQARATGELRSQIDPEIQATILLSYLRGATLARLRNPSVVDDEAVTKTILLGLNLGIFEPTLRKAS